jgi:hypothetical protein
MIKIIKEIIFFFFKFILFSLPKIFFILRILKDYKEFLLF